MLSKKKAADRTQHNLRSFSAPLRPSSPADTPTGGNPGKAAEEIGGRSGGADHPVVKITVPANLPKDADDVVARLKSSMMAFKQVCWACPTHGGRLGGDRFRYCEADLTSSVRARSTRQELVNLLIHAVDSLAVEDIGVLRKTRRMQTLYTFSALSRSKTDWDCSLL